MKSRYAGRQGGNGYRVVALLMGAMVASCYGVGQTRKYVAPPPHPAPVTRAAPIQRATPARPSMPVQQRAVPFQQAPHAQTGVIARPAVTAPQVPANAYNNRLSPTGRGGNRYPSAGSGNAFRGNNPSNVPAKFRAGPSVPLKSGGMAHYNAGGQIRSIDRNGTHVQYGAHGVRTTFGVRNGASVVTMGAHHGGYVQRPYLASNGHTYVQRTYVQNNVVRTVAYRSYSYHGTSYYGYAPTTYYRPAFYGWAYSPWRRPIYYSWGWSPVASPWYGYYGSYFTPYPVYASAAFWLTDYLVAQNLQAAYAARVETAPAAYAADTNAGAPPVQPDDAGGPPPPTQSAQAEPPTAALTPDMKQLIAAEVEAELAASKAAAGQAPGQTQGAVAVVSAQGDEVPPALDPNFRTFVVSSSLDVVANDQECTLTPGDVIQRIGDTPDQNQKVTASVASSQKADCGAGKQITVAVADLQEMQNHFREQLDSGLTELATRQGKGGLPKAPDTTQVAGEVPPPVADGNAAQTVQGQEAAADQAEKDATRETRGQGTS